LPPNRIVVIKGIEKGAPMPANPMESRMARLEGTYEQVSQRLMNIDPRFDGIDRRFDAVDRGFEAVDRRFEAIDLRFDAVDRKIDLLRDAFDKKFDALDAKIETIDAKIDQRFMWMIGMFATTWLTTIASIYIHH